MIGQLVTWSTSQLANNINLEPSRRGGGHLLDLFLLPQLHQLTGPIAKSIKQNIKDQGFSVATQWCCHHYQTPFPLPDIILLSCVICATSNSSNCCQPHWFLELGVSFYYSSSQVLIISSSSSSSSPSFISSSLSLLILLLLVLL